MCEERIVPELCVACNESEACVNYAGSPLCSDCAEWAVEYNLRAEEQAAVEDEVFDYCEDGEEWDADLERQERESLEHMYGGWDEFHDDGGW